eukprot:696624-Amphidinium_carterae.1
MLLGCFESTGGAKSARLLVDNQIVQLATLLWTNFLEGCHAFRSLVLDRLPEPFNTAAQNVAVPTRQTARRANRNSSKAQRSRKAITLIHTSTLSVSHCEGKLKTTIAVASDFLWWARCAHQPLVHCRLEFSRMAGSIKDIDEYGRKNQPTFAFTPTVTYSLEWLKKRKVVESPEGRGSLVDPIIPHLKMMTLKDRTVKRILMP